MNLYYATTRACWVLDGCSTEDRRIPAEAGFSARYVGEGFGRRFKYWYTMNPRVALKLAAHADAQTVAQMIIAAEPWPDPDCVSIEFDGEVFRWYAPVINGLQYRDIPQSAGWLFRRMPALSFWETTSKDDAVLAYEAAVKKLGQLNISKAALAVIEERIAYYRGWANVPERESR